MLPTGMEFRPMADSDIEPVLTIIRRHDEDDYEAAHESYEESGTANQYVLTDQGRVVGVSGCRYIDYTDRSYWLSWTYIDEKLRHQGTGEALLREMLNVLGEMGARRLFVNTSDLPVYADAIRCYQSVGLVPELKYEDYYEPGESRLTYGRRIGPLYGMRPVFEPNTRGVALTGYDEIDETDGAYFVGWDYSEDGSMFRPQELTDVIHEVRNRQGRCMFVGFPSALQSVEQAFEEAGFFKCGRLLDFYEDGLDEVHYRLNV